MYLTCSVLPVYSIPCTVQRGGCCYFCPLYRWGLSHGSWMVELPFRLRWFCSKVHALINLLSSHVSPCFIKNTDMMNGKHGGCNGVPSASIGPRYMVEVKFGICCCFSLFYDLWGLFFNCSKIHITQNLPSEPVLNVQFSHVTDTDIAVKPISRALHLVKMKLYTHETTKENILKVV